MFNGCKSCRNANLAVGVELQLGCRSSRRHTYNRAVIAPPKVSPKAMFRQSLIRVPRTALVSRRCFTSSATLRALPSMKDDHTIDKPKKGEHDVQSDSATTSQKEKEKAKGMEGQEEEKEQPPTDKQGPSAGIGLQDERGSTKGGD